jgi:hypothetical protein
MYLDTGDLSTEEYLYSFNWANPSSGMIAGRCDTRGCSVSAFARGNVKVRGMERTPRGGHLAAAGHLRLASIGFDSGHALRCARCLDENIIGILQAA